MTTRPRAELLESRRLMAIDLVVPQTEFAADPNLQVQSLAAASDGAGRTVVAYADRNASTGLGNEVFVRRFNGSGAVAAAAQVNTTTAGSQQNVDVATSASGRFVVVWQSAAQDGSGYGIYARAYDSAGTPLTGEIAVNSTTAGDQIAPSVAVDSIGQFVVTWQDGDADVRARRFAVDGAALGADFAVDDAGDLASDPDVAVLANGNFVIALVKDLAANGVGTTVFIYEFDAGGSPLGSGAVVGVSGPDDEAEPSVAAAGIDFVIAYTKASAGGRVVYVRNFGGGGSNSVLQVSQDEDGDRSRPRIAGDAAGNFTVAWTRQEAGAFYSTIDLRAYDATSTPTGNEFSLGDGTSARTLFGLVSTGTGTFRDVSTIGEFPGYGVPIGASFANALALDGTAGADAVTVSEVASSTKLRAVINGASVDYLRSAYAYIRADLGAGNDRWDSTRATMPTTIKGGDGDDRILTGDGRDSVSGGAGEDYISTAGENDYVIGDSGGDSIYGGEGNDTLTGSGGGNRLYGGGGNDRLKGSNSRDFLYGEAGDDRLEGGAGNDYLDGGGNVDRIYGGDGDDSLIGGSSVDRLYGENGNDSFVGGNGKDYLFGGPGTDDDRVPDASDLVDSIEIRNL